jgi:hypothetical protein
VRAAVLCCVAGAGRDGGVPRRVPPGGGVREGGGCSWGAGPGVCRAAESSVRSVDPGCRAPGCRSRVPSRRPRRRLLCRRWSRTVVPSLRLFSESTPLLRRARAVIRNAKRWRRPPGGLPAGRLRGSVTGCLRRAERLGRDIALVCGTPPARRCVERAKGVSAGRRAERAGALLRVEGGGHEVASAADVDGAVLGDLPLLAARLPEQRLRLRMPAAPRGRAATDISGRRGRVSDAGPEPGSCSERRKDSSVRLPIRGDRPPFGRSS